MQLTKYEHACLLVKDGQQGLLIDPGKYTNLPDGLANIQTIIVSDEHADHFDVANLRKILAQNPEANILSTETNAKDLANEGIECVPVNSELTVAGSGFDIHLREVDHAVVYGKSPCRVLTIGLSNFLYYASDSFVESNEQYVVLALPTGGPWFNMTKAIDLAKAIRSEYVIATHNGHLSEAGNQSNNRFVAANLGEDREFVYLEAGQSKEFGQAD